MFGKKTKRIVSILCSAMVVTLLTPKHTMAWGNKGHIIVAHIAYKLLSDNARADVNELLSEGESLETVATWADDLRGSFNSPGVRPETPLWHFVDIPRNENYVAARDCAETPNGSCAINALVIFQDVLAKKRPGYYGNSRYEALKFLVHFVGDLHQPLHCIDDHDFGGNLKKVDWIDGNIWKLHGVWDDGILSENMKKQNILAEIAYADFLFGTITSQQKLEAKETSSNVPTTVSRPVIEEWAIAAHIIANSAYNDLGPVGANHRYTLTQTYYDNHKQQVDDQLKRAGIRLAKILNENLR